MELRHLRYFIGVAEASSVSAAARALRVAQPALSRQIRTLEEELGVPLFHRDRHGVRLTNAGESFLNEARLILERSERAILIVRSGQPPAPAAIHLAYVWGLFHSLVPPLLSRFRASHPEVAVHLLDWTATQQVEGLREGRVDAGFIGFPDDAVAAGLAWQAVGRCALQAVLPSTHAAARQRVVRLESLAKEPFVAISERHYPGAARLAWEACSAAGFRPGIVQTADRGHALLGLVASGSGVALLPEPLAALPHPGVVFRPLHDQPRSELCVTWNPARPNAVRDQLLESIAAPETTASPEVRASKRRTPRFPKPGG